jgi:hypothetical protein
MKLRRLTPIRIESFYDSFFGELVYENEDVFDLVQTVRTYVKDLSYNELSDRIECKFSYIHCYDEKDEIVNVDFDFERGISYEIEDELITNFTSFI